MSADHELTENIVHLVLAKIPGVNGKPVPGVEGISLFTVPKLLADTEERVTIDSVTLADLNRKLGWRETINTRLNFSEGKYPVRGSASSIGHLVGRLGEGLQCVFHMMNKTRTAIGMASSCHARRDFLKSRG